MLFQNATILTRRSVVLGRLFAKSVKTLLFSVTFLFWPVPVLKTIDQLSSEQPNSTAKATFLHPWLLLQVFSSVLF